MEKGPLEQAVDRSRIRPTPAITAGEQEKRARAALHERIEHDFRYHAPASDTSKERHAEVNALLSHVAHVVADLTPPGREQSIVITKLEEARFWANAAIARAEGH